MVARVEDCFLGKEPGLGAASSSLHCRWRWNQGVGGGDLLHNGNSYLDVARSGGLLGFPKGLHNVVPGVHSVQPLNPPSRNNNNNNNNSTSVTGAVSDDQNVDSGILSSFVSSYLMQQQQQASGRATAVAPGAPLARNRSFESINNTGSCSTPSFCVGSPVTVFPSRPSDSFTESRVVTTQSQLSDHYLSNDSLGSYGSMEELDAIVNCVDDFGGSEPLQLPIPEFRFEQTMLDDTADNTGQLSFSPGELGSLVSTNHGPSARTAARGSLSSMIAPSAPAPDFCQSFFAGHVVEEPDQKPVKPSHLAIPSRGLAFNAASASAADHQRLRWSDEPWMGTSPPFANPPPPESKSSPSSPTTPLDPHLFASSKIPAAGSNTHKRSFAAMSGEKVEPANADKFDAAALSALLYSNTQSTNNNNNNNNLGAAYSFIKDSAVAAAPAPKQRRRHGTATDPQSIAARTRREKFTDRIRVLQSLVPNGERLDTVHMLSQTFEYVRFLQHKVWDLYNGKDSIADVKCEKWKEFVDTATGQVIV